MIRVSWGPGDVTQARFTYSPMVELAESLWLLRSGRAATQHHWWLRSAASLVPAGDRSLLAALVPARASMADFLFGSVSCRPASLPAQLGWVARQPAEALHAQLQEVWGVDMPGLLRDLLDGPDPGRVIADVLERYWQATLERHWPRIRGMLEEDIAYRAATLASDGLDTTLAGLHEQVRFSELTMSVGAGEERSALALEGRGMLFVPSVFAWPLLALNSAGRPSLIYGARGVGRLTESAPPDRRSALSDLLGRSRTQILLACHSPATTTELAVQLSQSPGTVSQHLSVLRRGGLLLSWRHGRRVLYRRTPLGDSIVAAQTPTLDQSRPG